MNKLIFIFSFSLVFWGCLSQKKAVTKVVDTKKIAELRKNISDSIATGWAIKFNHYKDSLENNHTGSFTSGESIYLLDKNDFNIIDYIKDYGPILLALIAIIFSYLTLSNDRSYKNLAFLSEVDKMLIENPSLWAIYDENLKEYKSELIIKENSTFKLIGIKTLVCLSSGKLQITPRPKAKLTYNNKTQEDISSPNSLTLKADESLVIDGEVEIQTDEALTLSTSTFDDLKFQGQLKAFCYYKLNNFELALKKLHWFQNKDSWEKYLKDVITKSSKFKNIANDAKNNEIFNKAFRDKLTEICNSLSSSSSPPLTSQET